ncbi:MAG: class I SAM-dependent methyltransferase [Candidatus Hydrothermales bacterium]
MEAANHIESYVSPFNNEEYKLYHCSNCDLQWWEPLRSVSPEFYEQELEVKEGYILLHEGIDRKIGKNHEVFFKYIPLKTGRLLDIGCGDGLFLEEAKRRGYEVWGIDIDRNSIRVCQEKRGLRNTFVMAPQDFAEFCQKEGLKFDIITFFEVLEHQDKIIEFMEAAKSILKLGGWIAGSVPNRNGRQVKIVGKYTIIDFPPEHPLRFSSVALSNLLYKVGFHNHHIIPLYLSIYEDAYYLTLRLLRLFGDNIKNTRKICYRLFGSESLRDILKAPAKARIYNTIKYVKNSLLMPIVLVFRVIYRESHVLYFQGELLQKN